MLKKHSFLKMPQYSLPVWHAQFLAPVSLRPQSLLWLVSSHAAEPAPLTVSPVGSVVLSASS